MTPAEVLERTQWDVFWVPADVQVTDRPDLLMLQCARPAAYVNTVLRTRAPAPEIPALVQEVEQRFGPGRGRWMVPDTFDTAPLEQALARRGWTPAEQHQVRVLPVDAWTKPAGMTVKPVDSRAVLLDCMAVADRAFAVPTTWTEETLAADLQQCRAGSRVFRVVAYTEDGTPVSSGGLTAFPALGFGLLWGAGTVPEARGRGAYSAVLSARVQRARELGLHAVGLYAREETSAPIVARLGFREGGRMGFWNR